MTIHGAISLTAAKDGDIAPPHFSLTEAMQAEGQLLDEETMRRHRFFTGSDSIEKLDFSAINIAYGVEDKQRESKSLHNADAFRVRCLNIMHPLYPTLNMVTASTNQTRYQSFVRELETGAKCMLSYLQKQEVATDPSLQRLHQESIFMDGLFQKVFLRFGTGWKPDVPTANAPPSLSLQENALASLQVEPDEIWDAIHYGSLLIDGRVTEAGFRMLFKDFLVERGALPVGEIGKMLQDSTGITTLSTSLKLKFGGLKKFLEKYPNDFVIGVNHPFNPHV